jgi:hypothetical protein
MTIGTQNEINGSEPAAQQHYASACIEAHSAGSPIARASAPVALLTIVALRHGFYFDALVQPIASCLACSAVIRFVDTLR